jgi:hypothetical protein
VRVICFSSGGMPGYGWDWYIMIISGLVYIMRDLSLLTDWPEGDSSASLGFQFIMLPTRRLSSVRRGMAAHRRLLTTAVYRSLTDSIHATMPPGLIASVRPIETFILPERVTGTISDQAIAEAMIRSWRRDGILQIAMSPAQRHAHRHAEAVSRGFFRRPAAQKSRCVDGSSYSGYIASGEEMTGGVADYSEIFTVTKDLSLADERVRAGWPCHGPCPWPDRETKGAVTRYMEELARSGEKLLQLTELGLGVPEGSITRYTRDGWHHLRMLR